MPLGADSGSGKTKFSQTVRRINPDKKIQSVLQKTRDSSRQAVSSIRSAG